MASSDTTRLLLVEDVPQVAQYIRGLLNSQSSVKLLDVLTDGSKVIATVQQLRPDVVVVDALLQGRIKGLQLVEQLKEDTAIEAADTLLLTVPNQLGVDYNAHVIESVLRDVAPALGWR